VVRVNGKQCVSVDPAATYLEQLSKAALIDVLVDMLRRESGEEGHVVRELEAERLVSPVLRMRGDRIPKPTEASASSVTQQTGDNA